MVRGTVPVDRSKPELEKEAKEVKQLFESYEDVKMKLEKGQEYFVISAEWFKQWKTYVGYEGMGGGDFPGPILNEDIIEQETHQIVCDDKNQYLNINLKDNLKEEDHYIILNKEIWDFLSKRYGG